MLMMYKLVLQGLFIGAFLSGAVIGPFHAEATDELVIDETGDVGLGTANPTAALHLLRSDGTQLLLVEETKSPPAQSVLLQLKNNGAPQFEYIDSNNGVTWRLGMNNQNDFVINDIADLSIAEMKITRNGQLFVNGTQTNVPDYVFQPEYQLLPLEKVEAYIREHQRLPKVPSAQEIKQDGLNLTGMQMTLLEKVEELTLYTIQQEKAHLAQQETIQIQEQKLAAQEQTITEQKQAMTELRATLAALAARMQALEQRAKD